LVSHTKKNLPTLLRIKPIALGEKITFLAPILCKKFRPAHIITFRRGPALADLFDEIEPLRPPVDQDAVDDLERLVQALLAPPASLLHQFLRHPGAHLMNLGFGIILSPPQKTADVEPL
jgi:hypothetical protein